MANIKIVSFMVGCKMCNKTDGCKHSLTYINEGADLLYQDDLKKRTEEKNDWEKSEDEFDKEVNDDRKFISIDDMIIRIKEDYVELNNRCPFCGKNDDFDFWDIEIDGEPMLDIEYPMESIRNLSVNLKDIKKKLFQSIVLNKIKIPNPSFDIMSTISGYVQNEYLTLEEVEDKIGIINSEDQVIEFLKNYVFHINYPGGLITADFLESLIDSKKLAEHGIITKSHDSEFEIHNQLNIFIGDSHVRLTCSEEIKEIELYLFDNTSVQLLGGSFDFVSKLSIMSTNNSKVVCYSCYCKEISLRFTKSSQGLVSMSYRQYADIIGHGESQIKIFDSEYSYAWIRIFDNSICNLILKNNSYSKVHCEKEKNIKLEYMGKISNDKLSKEPGPVCIDMLRNKIYLQDNIEVKFFEANKIE